MTELRRALEEAELDGSLSEVAATLHVLKTGESESRSPLGPTLTAEVLFEGLPVRAILDTGSSWTRLQGNGRRQ